MKKINTGEKCSRGTSLLELLVVIALLGILTSLAYPKVGSSREHYILENTAWEIAYNMRMAQGHALKTGRTTRLTFYPSVNMYSIRLPEGREWIYLPDGVYILAINFPQVNGFETLTFNFLGTPNQGGSVYLANGRGDCWYRVIVTPVTGRVRVARIFP